MERVIDFVYLIYFGTHILYIILIDSQIILPSWIYPSQLIDMLDWYSKEYGDSMMREMPAWFKTFVICEIFILLPFSFVAFNAYWKGVSKNRWIRTPMIVYSTHVVTALTCIYNHIFNHDFSKDAIPGPKNTKERLTLAMFYFPYFIVPVLLLIDSLFNPVYTNGVRPKATARKQKVR